ncbi:MAG TPA: transposase [Bacteroidota bacterium]|nr:transposase [Bacteroidota bacterium]
MARSRYKIFENDQTYFLTDTIVDWIPLFTDPAIVEVLFDSLRFLQSENRLVLYAYVVMENHLHLITSSNDLRKEIGDFKSYTARKIIDYLKEKKSHHYLKKLKESKLKHKSDRTYQVWQEGSHPEMIQGLEMMRQKADYIHNNPVRRGYVDDPCHWRYSSARNYAGEKGLIEVVTEWI